MRKMDVDLCVIEVKLYEIVILNDSGEWWGGGGGGLCTKKT